LCDVENSSPSSFLVVQCSLVTALGGSLERQKLITDVEAAASFPVDTLLLPMSCVERAFQLTEILTAPAMNPDIFAQRTGIKAAPHTRVAGIDKGPLKSNVKDLAADTTMRVEVNTVSSCATYLNAMAKIRQDCEEAGTVPLYHYTSLANADIIAAGGLRMSTQGQGDGGVYFSTLGPASYDIGSPNYEKNIIIDCFGKSRVGEYLGKGKLDLCLVYSVEPGILQQAQGGRDNAKVVPKATFLALSSPREGYYYMPPTGLRAAFLLDSSAGMPVGYDSALIAAEAARDQVVKEYLQTCEHTVALVSSHLHRMADLRPEGIFAIKQMARLASQEYSDDDENFRRIEITDVEPVGFSLQRTVSEPQDQEQVTADVTGGNGNSENLFLTLFDSDSPMPPLDFDRANTFDI